MSLQAGPIAKRKPSIAGQAERGISRIGRKAIGRPNEHVVNTSIVDELEATSAGNAG